MNEFGDQNGVVYLVEVLNEIQETDTKIFCGLLETGEPVMEHIIARIILPYLSLSI